MIKSVLPSAGTQIERVVQEAMCCFYQIESKLTKLIFSSDQKTGSRSYKTVDRIQFHLVRGFYLYSLHCLCLGTGTRGGPPGLLVDSSVRPDRREVRAGSVVAGVGAPPRPTAHAQPARAPPTGPGSALPSKGTPWKEPECT